MDETLDVNTLVSGLLSESESTRKFAVFKLQGLLGDPSFADAFVQAGDGLLALRRAVLEATGNTQAYAFGSLNKLLELDMGWEVVDTWVVEKAVALAVAQPLVNIVRNALTLLVLVVSRPLQASRSENVKATGFSPLKPALEKHPGFLESLVGRLSASDHGLCANALQLVNALMRDAVMNGGEHEWPRFIKRLQDLGVIGGVGMLMRGEAAIDAGSSLAAAILEFQGLTKTLLRKWRSVRVNLELHEHQKALKTIHLLSKPEPYVAPASPGEDPKAKPTRKHHPEKWRRLGFETESPAWEFEDTGFLGMMDLVDYAKRNEDTYQKMFMEQAVQPRAQRCPIARASLGVTLVLFEHFEIEENSLNLEDDGIWDRREMLQQRVLDARATGSLDRLYRPLLLQWGRLHTAALNAFVRLWKLSGAAADDDFYKIEELVRILVERIVGAAPRKLEVSRVEENLRSVTLETARKWQMQALDEIYDDAWGRHLVPVREQLQHESLQFMKEQRIRCLLAGSWFPTSSSPNGGDSSWRFARLNPTRRWLHYRDYATKGKEAPSLESITNKIELSHVTSVDSSVSTTNPAQPTSTDGDDITEADTATPRGSVATLTKPLPTLPTTTSTVPFTTPTITAPTTTTTTTTTTTVITLIGTTSNHDLSELPLLTLLATDASLASEWLDGLLMLLNQAPITKETTNIVELLEDWGVRLRLLNLRWEDVDWEGLELNAKSAREGAVDEMERRPVPSREGTEEDYWFGLLET